MNLQSIRNNVRNRLNKMRALDRIVSSGRFAAALSLGSEDEIAELVKEGNAEALDAWVNSKLIKELDDMSMRELRLRASTLSIAFYTTYRKDALIKKIIEVQNARQTQQTSVDVSAEEVGHDTESFRELIGTLSDATCP